MGRFSRAIPRKRFYTVKIVRKEFDGWDYFSPVDPLPVDDYRELSVGYDDAGKQD